MKLSTDAVTNYLSKDQTLTATLFPNPTNGKFKVLLKGEPQDKIELNIVDISGKTIKKHAIRNFTGEHTEMLNLKLPNGIYSLLIFTKDQKIQREFIIN